LDRAALSRTVRYGWSRLPRDSLTRRRWFDSSPGHHFCAALAAGIDL